jgi:hypothetical protein
MFISFFYFAVSLLLSVGLINRKRVKIDAIDLGLGFSLIFIICGICGLFFPKYCPPIILFFTVISLIQIIRKKKYLQMNRQPFDFSVLLTLFSTIYISVMVFGLNLVQKFYVNPDPSGYSSVTGLMVKHNGLINGLRAIKNYTGTPFSFSANWDDPNAFEWKQSPWNIPDSTDKYGIANGMYLHNGGSYNALIFDKWIPEVESFWISWASLTIFGLALIIGLIFKICESAFFVDKNLKTKFDLTASKRNKGFFLFDIRFLLALIIFISIMSSPWSIPMLWEGFLNQYWSYALTLMPIAIAFSWGKINIFENIKTSKQEYLAYLIVLLSTGFVYAQQLPWVIGTLLSAVAIREKNRLFRNLRQSIKLVTASVLIGLSSLLTPIVKSGIGYLTGSGGGGSTHLGFFSILRNFGFSAPFNYIGSPASPINYSNEPLFNYAILPNSGYDNLNFQFRGQGYPLFIDNISLEPIFLICILLINIFLYIYFLRRFLFLSFLPAAQLIVMYFYLVTHLGESLRNQPNRAFNDYIWMRLSAVATILLLTSILYPIFYKLNSSVNIRKILVYSLLPVFILSFYTCMNNLKTSSALRSYSMNPIIISDCDSLRDIPKEGLFISDGIVPELSITRCGGRYEFLNDQFPSKHGTTSDSPVYYINREPESDSWVINKIGILQSGAELISPCNLACLNMNTSFKSDAK